MGKELIQIKLELIAARAKELASRKGHWWASDLQHGMSEITKLADEISRESGRYVGGDR